MTQKLAIAISGAVSLGSYEAGVMYEIVEAIAQHNDNPETTEDEKIEIDVITGASAGGMTACILAQKLLFAADELRDSNTNALFNAWVQDVDLELLLQMGKENPNQSIFSSALIAEIGERYLLQRYKSNSSQGSPKRHLAAAAEIRLGIAMSNLNGFDFKIPLANLSTSKNPEDPNRSFVYTQHKDRAVYILNSESDREDLWKEIELRGRSSGAFPFAFRVLPVERRKEEEVFTGSVFGQGEKNEETFAYTDGGAFENEPLGMAKKLVNQIDRNPRDYEKRFFLFVAPGAKGSTVSTFKAEEANYLSTGKAIAGAIFAQARFQDWIATSKINEAIQRFDRQAIALKDLLLAEPADKQTAFDTVADSLLTALYQTQQPNAKLQALQDKDNKRLREQFTKEYQELKTARGDQVAETWLKTIQTLEKSADLGSKDLIRVYAITSNNVELGGEKLSAFGGFFGQNIREHDYNVGRYKAIDFLKALQNLNENGQVENQIFIKRFSAGQDIGNIDPQLGKLGLDGLDLELRKRLIDRLLDQIERIVDSLENKSSVQKILFKFAGKPFFRKQLNRLLKIN
jgi:hypothetical protein